VRRDENKKVNQSIEIIDLFVIDLHLSGAYVLDDTHMKLQIAIEIDDTCRPSR